MEYCFPTKINGYVYAKECFLRILEAPTPPSNKELFLELSFQYNTDSDNIERCLRTLIDKTWAHLAAAGLFHEKPTIREFILKCTEFIANGSRHQSAYDILSRQDWVG
jgi:hypothetical protein